VIAGDFDPATLKPLVEKYFGSIPKGGEPPPLNITTQPITAERRATVEDEVELPKVYFAWIGPRAMQAGDAEMALAATILGLEKTGRLEKALVLDKPIAQEVSVAWYSQVQGSILEIGITGNKGQTPESLEKAAWPVIEALTKQAPTAAEVERARRQWQADTLRGLEKIGGFGGKADLLNYYHTIAGDAGFLPKDFARYDAVTPESIQKTYAETVRADNRVIVTVVPVAGGAK
jgi:zinc protease